MELSEVQAFRKSGFRKSGHAVRGCWLTGAVLAIALVGGCANIPHSGSVQAAKVATNTGGGSSCCGLDMAGPPDGASPQEIVRGFLTASASFDQEHAIARKYLTRTASRLWRPTEAVTILGDEPAETEQNLHAVGPPSEVSVLVAGTEVATVTGNGQYVPSAVPYREHFTLESVRGQWRIAQLPSNGISLRSQALVLIKSLFNVAYSARNLYFFGPSDKILVPDPVFVPLAAPDPARMLVSYLLRTSPTWLQGAAGSAFPTGTRLLGGVQTLPGKTAGVDLSVPGGLPSQPTLRAMAAQLVWTLTSSSYGQADFQAVKLTINGHPWPGGRGTQLLVQNQFRGDVPVASATGAYYLTARGAARMLSAQVAAATPQATASEAGGLRTAETVRAVPCQAGTGQIPLSAIAVSPDQRYLAGVAGPSTTLFTCVLSRSGNAAGAGDTAGAGGEPGSGPGNLRSRLVGSGLSAPSWDSSDGLWVAGRVGRKQGVWVLRPAASAPIQVSLPPGLGPVTALRVAPDGIRIAMIVGTGPAARLVLAAIVRNGARDISILHTVPIGPGLAEPSSLTWFAPDHLLVTTRSSPVTPLWEVPVNGGAPTAQDGQPGMLSITAGGRGQPIYSDVSTGRLYKSVGLGEPWEHVTAGYGVVYPG